VNYASSSELNGLLTFSERISIAPQQQQQEKKKESPRKVMDGPSNKDLPPAIRSVKSPDVSSPTSLSSARKSEKRLISNLYESPTTGVDWDQKKRNEEEKSSSRNSSSPGESSKKRQKGVYSSPSPRNKRNSPVRVDSDALREQLQSQRQSSKKMLEFLREKLLS
jgi:hypothetical protein